MSTFRYWQTPRAGNMARLTLHTGNLPALADNHVRIKVHAVGLNFADIFALTGLYSATPQGAFIPGLEFAGEVEGTRFRGEHEFARPSRSSHSRMVSSIARIFFWLHLCVPRSHVDTSACE